MVHSSVRILVLQESDWVERGPHQSHHLFERLSERGHGIRVVDFEIGWRERHKPPLLQHRTGFIAPPKIIARAQVEVVRPAAIHLAYLDYASILGTHKLEIRRQFREFRPDILVGLGLLNAFSGMRQAKRAGVPFVYYLIDELHRLVPQPALSGLAQLIEQANIRRASLVLSINRALWEYTISMGASPGRSKVLPAGVDVGRYAAPRSGSDVRQHNGLSLKDLVLFFMGWVYPFSGLREVAATLVAGEGQEARARLLVVGKGDAWSELTMIVEKAAVTDRIKMVEFQPYSEMPSYLAAADVCLLPARNVETMRNIVPIKIYEYLAAGKPVIATRLPGLMKEFGEGHGIVYVDGPEQVVSKAVELAQKGTLDELGAAGRMFVAENDWNSITDTFESYLTALVNRRGPRS